jgi:uncharacterized FlaG/YvyC family protein
MRLASIHRKYPLVDYINPKVICIEKLKKLGVRDVKIRCFDHWRLVTGGPLTAVNEERGIYLLKLDDEEAKKIIRELPAECLISTFHHPDEAYEAVFGDTIILIHRDGKTEVLLEDKTVVRKYKDPEAMWNGEFEEVKELPEEISQAVKDLKKARKAIRRAVLLYYREPNPFTNSKVIIYDLELNE